jgi:hypothetical protein
MPFNSGIADFTGRHRNRQRIHLDIQGIVFRVFSRRVPPPKGYGQFFKSDHIIRRLLNGMDRSGQEMLCTTTESGSGATRFPALSFLAFF